MWRTYLGISSSVTLIAIGAYSLTTKVWHYRSGELAEAPQAMFFGGFVLAVGFILLVVQVWEIKKRSR